MLTPNGNAVLPVKLEVVPSSPKVLRRDTAGLRALLFDELEAFIGGRTPPERVRSVAALANAIVDSARLELEFARYNKTRARGGASKTRPIPPVRLAKRQMQPSAK